ncbi:uncharacterized protein BDR25DRAFT_343082 [Lindgomyces ingoldianus]|uniref:Uncharacterized protein n=1 Tax=Lindgomyces ingoldianus TaxID=673940 RepID=A0ACB6QTV8_9PLEO|nr:uncharacterized protein BDR25DRAFT_343082 [Lindgomyces ingoldianus]KAF2470306.1 hypothetical protein BDR25DRAFT_343082 [Lindgomyces ingoldianus]
MASKTKFFSWSKGRQSASEPYHRTGGLLAIDTGVGDTGKEAYLAVDAKNTPRPGRHRPPNLTIIPDYGNHHTCLSPSSALQNAALFNSASNLLAVVNDMLRSPALSATACPRSAEIHKPLPSRPRSISLPSTPELPVELPGSILLENQGFPSPPVAGAATRSTMRSVRSGNSLSSSAAGPKTPSKAHAGVPRHKKSLSETNIQRRSKSKPNLLTSPSSTDSKLTTCSVSSNGGQTSSNDSTRARVGEDVQLQPAPLIIEGKPWTKTRGEASNHRDELSTPTPMSTHSKQVEELKATITAQDQTISTLQAQFTRLRTSQEAHIKTLVDSHRAEVAYLEQGNRLHHASSNHLLLLLDTAEPQSPNREQSPQTATGSSSATSTRSFQSFQSALELQGRPHNPKDNPEMENLKRKLSSARRPETGNRDTIRELNQYKQNNAALQKQIESLMTKLNQSKKSERNLTQTLEEIEKQCSEWQEKARKVEQLEKNSLALQNTIDHLENRLEMANCDKLDLQEQLFNVQSKRDPFDPTPAKLQVQTTQSNSRQSAHSMSTVFSSGAAGSPTSHNESQDPTTLSAFISHIERLQEQIKQKDSRITQLEQENERARREHKQLEHDHHELNLQSDIQSQLLKKTRDNDAHIEQLRTAIIDREALIGEREKSLRMAERQLEHHKLLLHAEIRKHATMTLLAGVHDGSLPDLTSLASKEDIDRWIERLQHRLKKGKCDGTSGNQSSSLEEQLVDLKKENDFFVREIIYYKLDIKGYKSDIKKLKHYAARIGNHGSRAGDLDSPSPSLCHSSDTPIRARFAARTPGLGISASPSPISTGPVSATYSIGRPSTPPSTLMTPDPSPANLPKPMLGPHKRLPRELELTNPVTPHTPPRKAGVNPANEADNIDPGISPRSVTRLSPERRKPTPPSPEQEKFGELATSFPLSTPAAPKRHDTQRSMSDSIIQLYAGPRTPDWSPASNQDRASGADSKQGAETRGRSASVPKANKKKSIPTPDRPPRPRYGLYESPKGRERSAERLPTPPRMDVMAEAMRNSPDRVQSQAQPSLKRVPSNRSRSGIPGPGSSKLPRMGSSGSTSAIPPPLSLRPRGCSSGSSTTVQPPSPQRKGSNASASSIPFVIAMGSPHNPALITPATTLPPTTCSITGKSTPPTVPQVQSPTSRTGVGGTMASSTPLTSPVSPTDKSRTGFFGSALPVAKGSSSKPSSTTHSKNPSVNDLKVGKNQHNSGSRIGGHSRNTSGSSLMSAIQLPSSLMKGKGKARKDSISYPTPLASPFDIDGTNEGGGGGGSGGSGSGYGFGIGEAI